MQETIDFSHGKAFPKATLFTGYALLAISPILLFTSPILGILTLLIGGFIALTKSGIELNVELKSFREYTSYFGIKKGEWMPLSPYPYISILRRNLRTTAYSRGNVAMTTSTDSYFDICLLNSTHRSQILVQRHTNSQEAERQLKILAKTLGVEACSFSPKISEKTRAKR